MALLIGPSSRRARSRGVRRTAAGRRTAAYVSPQADEAQRRKWAYYKAINKNGLGSK
ncbi:MAG: hypothetical protein MZV70_07600 [Desulfobacterales bacterium]|nr:hypothetical protein [Desulfobacterales bacterium]